MDNKIIREEYDNSFYVIVCIVDGVKKYISKNYPNIFRFTIKLNEAKRFNRYDIAKKFFDWDKLNNPEIKNVSLSIRINEKI